MSDTMQNAECIMHNFGSPAGLIYISYAPCEASPAPDPRSPAPSYINSPYLIFYAELYETMREISN
jgi:hypothetical protein